MWRLVLSASARTAQSTFTSLMNERSSHLLVLWCCWFRSGLQTSSYFLVWCFSFSYWPRWADDFINWALRPVFILLSLCLYMIKVGWVEGIFSFSTEGRESRDFVEGYFAITSSHFEYVCDFDFLWNHDKEFPELCYRRIGSIKFKFFKFYHKDFFATTRWPIKVNGQTITLIVIRCR
jgi:hypothetical protein